MNLTWIHYNCPILLSQIFFTTPIFFFKKIVIIFTQLLKLKVDFFNSQSRPSKTIASGALIDVSVHQLNLLGRK